MIFFISVHLYIAVFFRGDVTHNFLSSSGAQHNNLSVVTRDPGSRLHSISTVVIYSGQYFLKRKPSNK